MDPSALSVNVRPHNDGGFCLEIRMFLLAAGDETAVRQVQGDLVGPEGPWKNEAEAHAAAKGLQEWWETL